MIELSITSNGWPSETASAEARARAALAATVAELGAELGDAAPAGEVSLLLADGEGLRVLNRDWRGKDTPTNVLSFPNDDDGVAPDRDGGPPRLLGDVAIAHDVVAAEAAAQAKRFGDHFSHLVVHGVLHLLGHDHEIETDAAIMEDLERRILDRLGIADPYADPVPVPAHVERR